MKLPLLVAALCPLAVGATDLGRGLLLGAAIAFCLLFTAAGEARLRPYMAPDFLSAFTFFALWAGVFSVQTCRFNMLLSGGE